MVAEQTGRTEGAVANRWYTKVSKTPGNVCFFTASPKHVSKKIYLELQRGTPQNKSGIHYSREMRRKGMMVSSPGCTP
jgi:hypothetical protein